MADNIQNTSSQGINVAGKPALVTDLNDSYISNEQYSYARNAVKNSKDGDLGTIGNEPSNTKCYSAPYKIIGLLPLPDDNDLVFSTDNFNSEIGIGNRNTCEYTKLNNNSCLNFHQDFPITGAVKKHSRKGVIVTFTDKRNPVRRIELNKLPKITDCNDILLWKKIQQPNIKITKGTIGNVPNGSYSVCLAYSVDGKIFSDYYSITNRVILYSETGTNSLEISISNLDKEFEKYSLVVVGNYIDPSTNGVTKVAKVVGEYSTKTSKVSVTDFINPDYKEVKLSSLVIKKRTWEKAGIVTSNSNYLIIADLVQRPEEDYQLKAMSIESEYIVEQVPADYYLNDGEDVGNYRDENYDYYIQGVYTSGEETDKFHVPGRRATASDLSIVSGNDVYENDTQFKDCSESTKVRKWQVENTASEMIPFNEEFKCDRRLYGRGKMGYHESTELYPDNKAMFGQDALTPIRFHRMPSEAKVPRYSIVNGKEYINILGVRFKNIPKFNNPDIIGYKITRSDRKGGNGTVVARGIITNVRRYEDQQNKQTIMYSNYTVNDLSPDQYLSSTQTVYKNGKETNFNPLKDYYKDRFSFYSPHTLFEPRYSLGQEIKIESEEIAEVTGQFEKVYNHPKMKLLTQFSFWLALAIGAVETYFEAQGLKNQIVTDSNGNVSGFATITGVTPGTINFGVGPLSTTRTSGSSISRGGGSVLSITGQGVTDAINDIIKIITSGDFSQLSTYIKTLKAVISLIASTGVLIGLTTVTIIRYAQEILDIINRFTGNTDYVYQYNALAKFTRSLPVENGNKRRRLLKPYKYIPSTVVSVDNEIFNNFLSEKTVLLYLNKPISDPKTKDTSRRTISGFGACNNPEQKVTSIGSAFYATSKVINPNQYGQLGSASPVSMHSYVIPFGDGNSNTSPVLYGGDCIISKVYIEKKRQFFNQNAANANFMDGAEYDYRLYRNIAYPRFWLDSTQYSYSELLENPRINFSKFNRTTANKHNLDCKKGDKKVPTRIDDAYMYLSNNCVMEFFVESDYNPDYREKVQKPFYSKDNTNLSDIFRSDRLSLPEEYKISRAYSDIYTTEIYAAQQRDDFDPLNPIPSTQPNSVIYSLPAFNLQNFDNWQYFLPENYFAFNESDFGTLTSIQKIDQDRLAFLFSKASPYFSMGRDFLTMEQSGRKITIGDGGLFAQDPREQLPSDTNYASSTSRYAFSNTHLGRFYPSENQGRIFNMEGFDDVSRNGMSFWCKNYMPIFLYKYFPDYPKLENPISGVGYQMVLDSFYETLYISKRDFVPKKELVKDIIYDKVKGTFLYRGLPISVRDTNYFNDVSWTLSYSIIDKAFISWHDWHPDLVVQTDNHFMTVKGNTVWKHNEAWDSFTNFYGNDYSFEWEPLSASGKQVETIRNIEYFLEAYEYKNFGRDRYHVKDIGFDYLLVHNSEQISPPLNLILSPENPRDRLFYPQKNSKDNISFDVLYDKNEQKYRINQFWDAVKDRNANVHLLSTDESGYKRVVNPTAIDVNKPEQERKKFRHNWNKFLLVRKKSGKYKLLVKILSINKLISPR
jgi:hypothetical protein